jgi:CRISPR-associated endonuclease/helicase Cas3
MSDPVTPQMHYAHSLDDAPQDLWEPLIDHLTEVGEETARRADKFGWGGLGEAAGLLHDLGKYKPAFQKYICKLPVRPEDKIHSTAGAVFANDRLGWLGKYIAHGIAGHHAGLKDGLLAREGRLDRDRSDLDVALLGHASAEDRINLDLAQPIASPDFRGDLPNGPSGFQSAFLTRMLFSCLVDADYICTERFYARARGGMVERGPGCEITDLADLLGHWMSEEAVRRASGPGADTALNQRRDAVLAHAVGHAHDPRGVFTLTVPTGGGKTLTSLAFALEHARHHGLDRVVVVIPFTSVIEQTAGVYREALAARADEILEHHSAFDESKLARNEGRQGLSKLSLAMETWDARIVVTTAVQFFESLFSDRPSRCRKLHNLANSVIILDEVQTVPLHLLRPCIAALKELARNYGSSIVLCTATQPALEEREEDQTLPQAERKSFAGGFRAPTELAPDVADLFKALRRVTITFVGEQDDQALASRFTGASSSLCVVNTRAHARELYRAIRDVSGAYHLSTMMHAAHRAEALAVIRDNLRNKRPCQVVSTSLIEAGVDISFSLVMRAEAGLDQIAQAAGRCNREGDPSGPKGEVLVFSPTGRKPHPSILPNVQAGLETLRRNPDDPLAPAAIEDYFRLLYWMKGFQDLDRHGVLTACENARRNLDFPFATIAQNMRLIDDIMRPIIVATNDEARHWLRELEDPYNKLPIGVIARKLQRYTIGIPERDERSLIAAKVTHYARRHMLGDQFLILDNLDLYKRDVGLDCSDPLFASAAAMIV